MDCGHVRRMLLAEPSSDDAGVRSHLATCAECTRYAVELRRFEGRLDRALRVEVNPRLMEHRVVTPLRAARPRGAGPWGAGAWNPLHRRWLAAAASLLLGTAVAVGLWLAAPGRSLAADVVNHMVEEPNAWARTDIPVPEPRLNKVLIDSHVRLKPGAGLVSYANSCSFRGYVVPHLVVQTDSGPVTVMVLVHEGLRSATRFNERGYRGVIVPIRGHGSLAVLERGQDMDIKSVEAVAARVQGSLDWTA
ncbi:MAG TPA: DUF3379 family protein [Steroidobacteraceae bacterium]|nr:DUF3379 family protein [Steroidobacteraceae bacterium]